MKEFFSFPFIALSVIFSIPAAFFLCIAFMIEGEAGEKMSDWMKRKRIG